MRVIVGIHHRSFIGNHGKRWLRLRNKKEAVCSAYSKEKVLLGSRLVATVTEFLHVAYTGTTRFVQMCWCIQMDVTGNVG